MKKRKIMGGIEFFLRGMGGMGKQYSGDSKGFSIHAMKFLYFILYFFLFVKFSPSPVKFQSKNTRKKKKIFFFSTPFIRKKSPSPETQRRRKWNVYLQG